MALRFYNTLSQQVEEFQPLEDNLVRMYTCGPTVYDYAHIGNFRTFTFYDLLRRWLGTRGYRLDHVMNITDVEDKIIRNALAQKKALNDYTATYEKAFFDDCAALRLEAPERWARATEHINEMADAIGELARKGYTYTSEGSVYFRIAKFPEYGRLSHNDFSAVRAGARVDVDTYEKADARDFVLWKAPKDGEPFWETPIGQGRPGWHIECSVMAIRYLGETLDIHAGGVDLIFPHHENEIAQSVSLTGKPFAKYWLHSEFLLVDGQKMSKSLGNYYTLREVLARGYPPETVRYLLASVPYRKQLNFTFDGLKSAATAVDRLRNFQLRLDKERFPAGNNEKMTARTAQAEKQFCASLDDDLNTAEALGAMFEYIRDANVAMDAGEFGAENTVAAREFLDRFDAIFDVLRASGQEGSLSDGEVEAKIAARTQAKKARNFTESDRLRDELLAQGIILEDTKDGVRWKRK
jgi:cysteinyl-tRNA synthetase